jgi:hypothetical protein
LLTVYRKDTGAALGHARTVVFEVEYDGVLSRNKRFLSFLSSGDCFSRSATISSPGLRGLGGWFGGGASAVSDNYNSRILGSGTSSQLLSFGEVAMVTDGQVKELRRLLASGKTLAVSARMTEMDEKTARQYRRDERLPSQRKKPRDYRTRIDPFAEVWAEVQRRLEAEPLLQAKTLFQWLQDRQPGLYPDSTRRTFERRVRLWRSTQGPNKPVMFPQVHDPGRIAASDFTVMNELHVTIAGVSFEHLLFHCVLTYSNVESVTLCFSESFEALSEGIQNAFWEFGGAPARHRTDSLSAAVNNHSSRKELTARYAALMDHYGCEPERINVRCANENGDVESSHGHLKNRIDQALLLRGSRDFASREDYMDFVQALIVLASCCGCRTHPRDRREGRQSR